MPSQKKPTSKERVTRVTVHSKCRPEPDWDRFAWAVLQHARIVDERSRREGGPESPR